jgi:phage terminase large subunit
MEKQNPEAIQIDFNPDLFNDLYWHLEEDFQNPDIRFIFLYGGSSASKTYTAVQQVITRMLRHQENTLILRKFSTDIKDSIYSDFKGVVSSWELNDFFVFQQNLIICPSTGSYVRFRGLDDSEKVKGISNFKRVILEEISQFDEKDFKQIRKRLRGKEGQQIIGIFNPISEEHWLKINLFDKQGLRKVDTNTNITSKEISDKGNFVVYKVTYLNNKYIVGPHFVDKHTIDDFEVDKINDNAYYQIYALGNWGRLRTGGEFWKSFDPNRHVVENDKRQLFRPDLPIHMTWDDNVNPYLPCSLWQTENKKIWQIDEFAFEDPLNNTKHVCNEFMKRYPAHVVAGLFVYGDRTAIKEDTAKEKGDNFYTGILKHLYDYRPRLRMPSGNPPVNKSRNFVDECYAVEFEGISIRIGSNCKKSIHDYTYTLEDQNGNVWKAEIRNPETNVKYQEFGHFSDAKRYLFTMLFPQEYQLYLTGRKGMNITKGRSNRRNGY